MIFGCIQHLDRNCYKLRTGLRFQLKLSKTETVRHLRHLLIFWGKQFCFDPQKPPAIHASHAMSPFPRALDPRLLLSLRGPHLAVAVTSNRSARRSAKPWQILRDSAIKLKQRDEIVCNYNIYVCQSVCQSVCLSVNLSVNLSVCLSICLSICLSVCLSIYLASYLI